MIGLFGGTFDPVHIGHLRLAIDFRDELQLDEVRLIPAGRPPHRAEPATSAEHRAAMLALACEPVPGLTVDRRELAADGPRFTVDTLETIRAETDESLVLLLGADSFVSLPGWHRWETLFELAHVAVMQRPGVVLPTSGPLAQRLTSCRVDAHHGLHDCPAGNVFLSQSSLLDVSSTRVRTLLAAATPARNTPRYLLPDSVFDYIVEQRLYAFTE